MGFGGPLKPIAIATAILCGVATDTEGFAPSGITVVRARSALSPTATTTTVLPALVYGADGSVVKDDEFDNDNNSNNPGTVDEESLLESLRSSVGNPSVWTAIACAFAPPPHDRLTPDLVRDAVPVGISFDDDNGGGSGGGGIDVAVAVPALTGAAANNQLVRVLVHARFPQAWAVEPGADHREIVDALVRQVSVLEGLARDRLSGRPSVTTGERDAAYYEKKVVEARWNERLWEEPPSSGGEAADDLPAWWTPIAPPFSSLELLDEAKLLKKLLNEDEFEDELRALFVRHGGDDDPFVVRAAVASVGSTGLFLKARLLSPGGSDDETPGAETLASVAVAYGDPPSEAKTTGDLREGVLTLVESVDPLPMPTRPQEAAEAPPPPRDDSVVAEPITPFNEQVVKLVSQQAESTSSKASDDDDDGETAKVADDADVGKETSEIADDDDVAAAAAAKNDVPEPDPDDEEAPEEVRSNQQPRPPDEEAKLAAKYAAIEDLGERAFAILRDLGMV